MKKENAPLPPRRFNESLIPLDRETLDWFKSRAIDLRIDPQNSSPLLELVRHLAAREPLAPAPAQTEGKHPLSARPTMPPEHDTGINRAS